ncbi:TetR family transcriptional regulator [Mycobacterium sp. BK558]|nr:TetR family transcriptional regulator [Mycobacterium sp. BK558]
MSMSRPPGRPPGSSPKGISTRQHIIDAAAGVFAAIGYDRARMADLVAATGMTKGAVYFHFDSKESLALAVLESKHQAWMDAVDRILQSAPDARTRLAALMPAMLTLHQEDPSTWAVSRLIHNLTELESTRERAAVLMRRWTGLVADLIRDAQRHGDIASTLDPDVAATVLVGAFDGLKAIHDTLGDGDEAFSAASALLNTMLLSYVAPEALSAGRVRARSAP